MWIVHISMRNLREIVRNECARIHQMLNYFLCARCLLPFVFVRYLSVFACTSTRNHEEYDLLKWYGFTWITWILINHHRWPSHCATVWLSLHIPFMVRNFEHFFAIIASTTLLFNVLFYFGWNVLRETQRQRYFPPFWQLEIDTMIRLYVFG